MICLLDSSAMINLISEQKTRLFINHSTITLARYEIGNVLWQNVNIRHKNSPEEGEEMYRRSMNVIVHMEIVPTDWNESFKLAVKENLAYYDAAYLYAAISRGYPLVTDDSKLRRIGEKYLRVLSSTDL